MAPISHSVVAAAGALQLISESSPGERGRRAAAGALVLRAVQHAVHGEAASGFVALRAGAEVSTLAKGAERAVLRRLLLLLEEGDGVEAARLADPLVSYACELERTRRLPEADAALSLALSAAPGDAETALHAARVARKLGDRERALKLYAAVRGLDGESGPMARLAAVGEAVVSDAPERALSRVVRAALAAGDAEAAAVGLEERARVRRGGGDRAGAARDLCLSAARFTDAVDRARVAHELADLMVVGGDSLAAREALLAALAWGDAPQKEHARARLHALARDMGDQVGARRWRSSRPPSLTSMSLYRPKPVGRSAAPRLSRWREALGEHAGCAS
jgi:tetratricopeptide (TPR) repeat protein